MTYFWGAVASGAVHDSILYPFTNYFRRFKLYNSRYREQILQRLHPHWLSDIKFALLATVWYPKWATISHASRHSFLRAACLPIPPFGHIKGQFIRDAQLSFYFGELGLATRNIWTSHGHSFILSNKHKHTSIVRIFYLHQGLCP